MYPTIHLYYIKYMIKVLHFKIKLKGYYEKVEGGYIDNIDREIINTIEYIKENVLI